MKKTILTGCIAFLFYTIQAQVKIGDNPIEIIKCAQLQINGTNIMNDINIKNCKEYKDYGTFVFYQDYTDGCEKTEEGGEGARVGIGTTMPKCALDVVSKNPRGTSLALRNYSNEGEYGGHNWSLKSLGIEYPELAGSFMIWDQSAWDGRDTGCNRFFINPFGKASLGGGYNPTANLEISNSGPIDSGNDRTTLSLNNTRKWILNSEGEQSGNPGSFMIWDASNSTNRFVIKPNGNVGVGGVYAPEANLEIRNGLEDTETLTAENDKTTLALSNSNRWLLNSEGTLSSYNGAFRIWNATNETPGFIIDANGDTAIGTSTTFAGTRLNVAGEIQATAIKGPSDKRFKKNIEPLESALAKVSKLKGYTYEWRKEEFPDRNFKSGKDMGLIAQEVEKIFPEVVYTNSDEMKSKSIDYSKLVPALIEAIKELQKEVEELKSQMPHQKR